MSVSAFGVETGTVSKGRFTVRVRRPKAPEPVTLDFKPIKPGVTPSGPGSMRGRMDPSAHETRLAAQRRRELGKSLNPIARTVRVSTVRGFGLERQTQRPDTWALKGKATRTWAQDQSAYGRGRGGVVGSTTVTGGGLTGAGKVAVTGAGSSVAAGLGSRAKRKGSGAVRKSASGVAARRLAGVRNKTTTRLQGFGPEGIPFTSTVTHKQPSWALKSQTTARRSAAMPGPHVRRSGGGLTGRGKVAISVAATGTAGATEEKYRRRVRKSAFGVE